MVGKSSFPARKGVWQSVAGNFHIFAELFSNVGKMVALQAGRGKGTGLPSANKTSKPTHGITHGMGGKQGKQSLLRPSSLPYLFP
jgi:hypothetical protein